MAIIRRTDYGKREPSKSAQKIYLVTEDSDYGPVEYFRFFEKLSPNLEVVIINSKEGETDPLKLMERAKIDFLGDNKNYTLDYQQHDQVWFVIDTDKWEEQNKIKPLRDFCEKKNLSIPQKWGYKTWNVAQSNPCFEIWYYYHFADTPPDGYDGEEKFKNFINKVLYRDYKIQRFECEYHPTELEKAIKNANNNFRTDQDGKIALFSTEMCLLGTIILPFVKPNLDKLKNKLGLWYNTHLKRDIK